LTCWLSDDRSEMATTLNVTVTRVCYPKSDANAEPESWYILLTNHGTCKGRMAWRPQENEQLILEGEWAAYQGNREFAFKTARLDVPTNPRDQLHYVCCRAKGLGEATEELIWAKAGAGWQNIEDGAVPRLSGRLYQEFRLQVEALHQKSEEAVVVAALMGKGATVNMAQRAWEQWKGETLGIVNADPYRLCELEGYGFRDVDRAIRQAYGIADSDKRRIKAAVVYVLRRITDGGDTVAAWADIFAQSTAMLGGYADEIAECTAALFEDGTLKAFPESEGVSLAADWKAENEIWDWVEEATTGGGKIQ